MSILCNGKLAVNKMIVAELITLLAAPAVGQIGPDRE